MGKTGIVTNSGSNLMQAKLEDCIAEIQEIETELNAQFELLGEQVDAGFKQIGELAKQGIHAAKYIGKTFDSDYGDSIALGGAAVMCAGAAVYGAIENVNAAKSHNAALDKMLKLKKQIAQEKLSATERLAERATKVQERIARLIDVETSKEYAMEDIKKSLFGLQLSNMKRTMAIYRLTCYSKIMVDFLCAEYQAWNRGKHCSSKNRPTYFDANVMIAESLSPNHNVKQELDNLKNANNLSGADMYIVTDPALLSVVLYKYGQGANDEDIFYDDDDDDYVEKIKALPKIKSPCAKKLLKKNEAYKSYKNYFFWFKYGQTTMFLGITVILLSIILALFYWLDWSAWIEWTLGIILSIGACVLSGVVSFDNDLPKDTAGKALNKQKEMAGFIKIFRPDFSKKNLLLAGITGAFKGAASALSD